MQYDMERFEQPLVDETQPKAQVWTDIGDAEVEHSIFGKARVRVYRKRDEVRKALGWTLLCMGLVVGAVWLIHAASRQPGIADVAPSKLVVESNAKSEPQAPVRVVPQSKPLVTPPIASTKPMLRAPVGISGASAPVAAKPAAAPVVAPAAITPEVFQAPIEVPSAVKATH